MTLSVLLSIYAGERADYLEACLKSVWYGQTRRPDELILVEDGPLTQDLAAVVAAWRRRLAPILRVVTLPVNQGLGTALNTGLLACRGTLVARIDADDLALPQRFAVQVKFMERHPEIDVLGSAAELIDAAGHSVGLQRMPQNHAAIQQLIWSCPVIHPSVMLRRATILKIGSYDQNALRRQEDYELWLRAVRSRLILHNLPEPLIRYRKIGSRKNDIYVGWHRMRIGWAAAREFDPRVCAYLGVTYPLVRALLPKQLAPVLERHIRHLDPRAT